MSLKLAARLVVLVPVKILDLKENDTISHVADLSAHIPLETQAILMRPKIQSGSGDFVAYPASTDEIITCDHVTITFLPIKNRELKWKNTVADDDWDIWLFGYFVQKRTR